MRAIDCVIVHHSDSSEYTSAKQIDDWHTDPNKPGGPFSMIGYHWVIRRGPDHLWLVEPGRPETMTGAHDRGANSRSIGVCVSGRYADDPIDPCALSKASRHIADILLRHDLSPSDVYGHSEKAPGELGTDATLCPGFNMHRLRRLIRVEYEYLNSLVTAD